MSTTYDPTHDLYLDEADVRGEMSRVFDICHECRRCVDLCTSFPTLFDMLDGFTERAATGDTERAAIGDTERAATGDTERTATGDTERTATGTEPDGDADRRASRGETVAGNMTPAQQDRVVDACYQCTLCAIGCPHGSASDDVDMPRLMLRATAMRLEHGHRGARTKVSAQILGRADLVGKLASRTAPLTNRVADAAPDSWLRKLNARLTGITARRKLPPYAHERFGAWFARRPRISIQKKQASVTLFPTCLVEYHAIDVGQDLVKVYERNGIECAVSEAGCCGAPWLHAGDLDHFTRLAEKNVTTLAAEIRTGTAVVVPQPTCSHVIKKHYPNYVGESSRADAELVASQTHDASEYLMSLHRGDDYVLDTDFHGTIPTSITYHAPSHLRSQNIGLQSRDLMRLTGARISVVQHSAGIESPWGYHAGNDEAATAAAQRLGDIVRRTGGDVVAGDCHLANTVIAEQTDALPMHPIQIIARAYGIPAEH
jgi:Fe-S oxidoreductase